MMDMTQTFGAEVGDKMAAENDAEFSWSKRGRKKSHPIWTFFEDLRTFTGQDMIKCKHCDFETSERNPSILTAHIKKNHSQGKGNLWQTYEGQSKEFSTLKKPGSLNTNGKQGDLLEELTKQISTHGSVRMDKNDIVGLLQNFITKADPNEASNIANLVTALNAPSPPAPKQDDSQSASANDETALDDDDALGTAKLLEDWTFVGTFNSFEKVEAARNAGKVVRHSVVPMKEGSKVKYRCSQWKRTHCPYRMHYVELDGVYSLYEKGEHVHVPIKASKGSTARREDTSYDDNQQFIGSDYLQSIISHAIESTAIEPKKEPIVISEFSSPPVVMEAHPPVAEASSCLTLPENLLNVFHEAARAEPTEIFSLSSGTSISNLLQISTELQLVFTFDARNAAQFCFSKSNSPQIIVFIDQGSDVIVQTKQNDIVTYEERWKKADSPQFIWAVKGILSKHFA